MCLMVTKQHIVCAKKSRKIPGKVYAWKVLRTSWYDKYVLSSKYFNHAHGWLPGWNCSDRKSVALTSEDNSEFAYYGDFSISHGIHVYLRKQDAIDSCIIRNNEVVVRVECHNKHLVSRNGKDCRIPKQAVYTKVFLSKEENTRALKEV